MKKLIVLVHIMWFTLCIHSNVLAADYSIRVLEGVAVPGFAESINNAGVVLCDTSLPGLDIFLWHPDGTITGLRSDNLYIGANNAGQTAGNYTDGVYTYPRIRNADGTIVDYAIPDGAFGAWPSSINDKGQIGCTVQYRDAEGNITSSQAVIYNSDGTMVTIPTDADVEISCINNSGCAVVRKTASSRFDDTTSYLWKGGTTFVALEELEGSTYTAIHDMNDDGLVIGTSGDHAVWWDSYGMLHDLGPGEAYSINALGQIVGTAGCSAVLWNLDGATTVLPVPDYAGTGSAKGINDNGWIVGYFGVENVGAHAVLWQPVPEPASLLALAAGLAGLAIRRRK